MSNETITVEQYVSRIRIDGRIVYLIYGFHHTNYVEDCEPMDVDKFPDAEGLYRLVYWAEVNHGENIEFLRHTKFVNGDFKLREVLT